MREVRGQVVQVEESGASLPNRFKSTLHSVYACGEYEKMMHGVFENYLNVKFKDSQFENVSRHEIMAVQNVKVRHA